MTLNPTQVRIAVASAVLFIAMGLYPPWSYTVEANSIRSEKPAGYALIFEPPEVERNTPAYGVRLYVVRLVVQWIILAAATGCVVLLAKRPRVSELEKQTNKDRRGSDQGAGKGEDFDKDPQAEGAPTKSRNKDYNPKEGESLNDWLKRLPPGGKLDFKFPPKK